MNHHGIPSHLHVPQFKALDTIPLLCNEISNILREQEQITTLNFQPIRLIDDDLSLDITKLDEYFNTEYTHHHLLLLIHFLSTECRRKLSEKSIENIQVIWEISINNVPEIWLGCDILKLVGEDAGQRVLGLCQATSRLEWIFSRLVKRRLLLKDNLLSNDIMDLLGHGLTVIFRCAIGEVKLLNLKNLIWHGFVSDKNIPFQHSCLIFVLIITLNKTLSEKYKSQPPEDCLNTYNIKPLIVVDDHDIQTISTIISNTSYIHPDQKSLWMLVLTESILKTDCFSSLCLNTILLQHVLRRIWITLSECALDRASAQCEEFYITFDEIFSPAKPGDVQRTGASYYSSIGKRADIGKFNVMVEFLGIERFHALLDLFVHADGPRLRDKLSHGEVHSITGSDLSKHVLFLSVSILVMGCLPRQEYDSNIGKFKGYCNGYKEQFHPISIILQNMQNTKIISERLFCKHSAVCSELECHHDQQLHSTVTGWIDLAREYCSRNNISIDDEISTLFVTNEELKFYNMVKTISNEIFNFCKKLESVFSRKCDDFRSRSMRSRQRKNFKNLLSFIPCYCMIFDNMKFMLLLMMKDFENIPLKCEKHLKGMLKCFENCCSLCMKSKWTDVNRYLTEYLQQFKSDLSKCLVVIS